MVKKEIEKKYLIWEDGKSHIQPGLSWFYPQIYLIKSEVTIKGDSIRQGYLAIDYGKELAKKINLKIPDYFSPIEARLRDRAGEFFFTLKGKGEEERDELEKRITSSIFNDYWESTSNNRIYKTRLKKPCQGHIAEIDVYTDRELILAEIEVKSLSIANSLIPLGKDVTNDPAYKNRNLAK